MREDFWLRNPYDLLNNKYIFNFIPNGAHTLESNLNAITRFILLLTFIGYTFTKSKKIIFTTLLTLLIVVLFYKFKTKYNKNDIKNDKKKLLKETLKEGFSMGSGMGLGYNNNVRQSTMPVKTGNYDSTKKNPLMNVMMDEYKYNPKRNKAQPSAHKKIEQQINENVKKNLDSRLFQNLGDNIEFSHSMRRFHTTANTEIPNDQQAFAKFCYGDMLSCKDGDGIQCVKNNYRWTNP